MRCPTIKFDCGLTRTLLPHDFFIGRGSLGAVQRMQFPLKLAWALTVHKCQGMTLSRCQIDV